MICPPCGSENPDGARVCSNCGSPFRFFSGFNDLSGRGVPPFLVRNGKNTPVWLRCIYIVFFVGWFAAILFFGLKFLFS